MSTGQGQLRSSEESLLARFLVDQQLATAAAIQAALGQRAPNDPRSLASLVVAAGLLPEAKMHAALAQVREAATVTGGAPPSTAGSGRLAPQPRTAASVSTRLRRSLAAGSTMELAPGHEFVCERLLGQGGMGVVYLVRDTQLGRRAALKLTRSEDQRPIQAKRFRRETVVTACLDHPNIPPVYEAGKTPAGDDYLLMRFVDGRVLSELVGASLSGSSATGLRVPERRELLDALVKVGEAVSYAHSQEVIHRDLKPDNVMVGQFGEVLVLDWGLARILSESVEEDTDLQNELGLRVEQAEGLTQQGTFLGTPGYMAPEQARGDDVDRRADVFALGAILYRLLSGEAPVTGESAIEVITRTAMGQVEIEARPGVPADLLEIVRTATQPDVNDRYPDADAFVSDLRAFLQGRPVSVYRYTALGQARLALLRHPTLFTAIGVAFVLSCLAVAGVTRASARAEARATARAEAKAAEASREAAEREARLKIAAAQTATSASWQAQQRHDAPTHVRIGLGLTALQDAQRWRTLDPASTDAAAAVFRAANGLGDVALEARQWELARQAFSQLAGLGRDAELAKALARVQEGETAAARGRRRAVEGILAEAKSGALREQREGVVAAVFRIARYPDAQTVALLTGALDSVTETLLAAEREALLGVVDPTPAEAHAGEEVIAGLEAALHKRQAVGAARLNAPETEAIEAAQERLLLRAQATTPLGVVAPTSFQSVVAARQARALGQGELDLTEVTCRALGRIGRRDGAVEALGRYLAAETNPRRAVSAGLSLCALGGVEAQAHVLAALARTALDLHSPFGVNVAPALAQIKEAVPLEGETARAYKARGDGRRYKGDREGALADYVKATELDPAWALAWNFRGLLHLNLGQTKEAGQACRKAAELDERMWEAWHNLALAEEAGGDLEAARVQFDKAIALAPGQAVVWACRANVRKLANDLAGAETDLDEALRLNPQFHLAWARRSELRLARRNLQGAFADASRAIELDPLQGTGWEARGIVLLELGKPAEARSDFEQAVRLAPKRAEALVGLALARARSGEQDGALDDARRATELAPSNAFVWLRRAIVHSLRSEVEEGLVALSKAEALGPATAESWAVKGSLYATRASIAIGRTGDMASGRADSKHALEALSKSLELVPRAVPVLVQRGVVQFFLGKVKQAQADLDKALEYEPTHIEGLVNRAMVRQRSGDMKGARRDLETAVERAPNRGDVWLNLGAVESGAGNHLAAVEAYTRALAITPGQLFARRLRADSLSALQRYKEAIADLDAVIAVTPDNALAVQRRGECHLELGHYAPAARDGALLIGLSPKNSAGFFLRGMARGRLGKTEEGITDLEKTLRLKPTGKRAKRARAALKSFRAAKR